MSQRIYFQIGFRLALVSFGTVFGAHECWAGGSIVEPSSVSYPDTSSICSGGSEFQKACVKLPGEVGPQKVDIFFLFDDTGSFADTAPKVKDIFGALAEDLQRYAPGTDIGFGVGRFEDFGGDGRVFGGYSALGRPFILNQPIVTKSSAGNEFERNALIHAALLRGAPALGGDTPEAGLEALYQVTFGVGLDASGDGLTTGNPSAPQRAGALSTQIHPDATGDIPKFNTLDPSVIHSGSAYGVGFRQDALKIVILAADTCPVAAFRCTQRESGTQRCLSAIPATINSGGKSESTDDFRCLNVGGNPRFGFISSSRDTLVAGSNDVAPAGSHSLAETVSALQSAGIRVLGLVPGDGVSAAMPKGSGPSGLPAVWLSAIARLTGGVDSSGTPLVYYVNNGGDELRRNLLQAIKASLKTPLDIAVRSSDATSGQFGISSVVPTVAQKLLPGEKVCFDLALSGGGSTFNSGFLNIDFFDVTSGLSLARTPVTVNCRAKEFSCSGIDINDERGILDNNSLALRNLVVRATKRLEKFGGSATRKARAFRSEADKLYKENWMIASSLPSSILNCPDVPQCVKTSTLGQLDSFRSNSQALRDLVKKTVKELTKHGNSRKDGKTRTQAAVRLHNANLTVSATIPPVTSSCTE